MSESQFAYGGLTLDELRSLAASPQVGTIQTMPQSFRALADRVGEVADLLTHAQADLPNWWKGPAAEQAAATLGRAAAEARDFHDSAMGAATTVGRCAQVVAEQQHQMLGVPEIPEPGITDVVQRPTTPFEALEAARQSASYHAAHEQAVQVVNGIAAQYVETRRQLSNIGMKFGENFTTREESTGNAPDQEIGSHPYSPAPQETSTSHRDPQRSSSSINLTSNPTPLKRIHSSRSIETSLRSPSTLEVQPSVAQTQGIAPHETASRGAIDSIVNDSPPIHSNETSKGAGQALEAMASDNPSLITGTAASPTNSLSEGTPASDPFRVSPMNAGWKRPSSGGQSRQPAATLSKKLGNRPARTARDEDLSAGNANLGHPIRSATEDYPTPAPQIGNLTQLDGSNNDYSPIISPYSGSGSMHRTRDERNPRPAYLKERKSAWLPDTVAAPADGVIGPDWPDLR